MSGNAIEVRNLGKRYAIGESGGYGALRDVLEEGLRHPIRTVGKMTQKARAPEKHVWALRDVGFELAQGEALGIVGMNGSGKTTLLRILSRITEPTEGEALIRGRITSLLEVGTGFHPELTGRENIFVNGILLGMSRQEVARREWEIIDFSGIEAFIDTPVKRYSSGMQLRLAFSVAAHLEPDVVLIDEVLAVGDVAFQTRCIRKMQEMATVGRTIVYVSHNLPSVASICDRAIILNKGRLISDGPAQQVVEDYVNAIMADEETGDDAARLDAAMLTGAARITGVTLEQDGVQGVHGAVDIGKPLRINISYEAREPSRRLFPVIHLFDQYGTAILSSGDLPSIALGGSKTLANSSHDPGRYTATCELPANFLNDKRYRINVIISELPDTTHVLLENAVSFDVRDTGEMRKDYHGGDWLGCIRPKLAWSTQRDM